MVNKTLAYEHKDYARNAVFAADEYDGYVSFQKINQILAASLPAGWFVETIDLDTVGVSVAQDQLLRAMNRGTALVTYTGHSGPTSWTFSGLFSTKQVAALTNTGRPFVVVQWGCWNNYYIDPLNDHLVQAFLLSNERGAAAALGAVTLTDSEAEKQPGQLLTPRLVRPGATIGLALQRAKMELSKTHPEMLDVLLGWTLMGDPALAIDGATH